MDQLYRAKLLNDDDTLQLFSLNAFQKYQPPKDYVERSKSVVKYSCGLPLALEVLGSFLGGITNVDEWKSAVERLSKEPEDEILNRLKISCDALSRSEKKIFLDIACFFKGESHSYVTSILDACGFCPTIGIRILIQRHLINIIDSEKLCMHDLLQEMGREIVNRESLDEPGERNRLWKKEDICCVLREDMGTKMVEGIMIEEDLNLRLGAEAFSKMINLRLLKIKNLQLPEGLNYLSNNLRCLNGMDIPLNPCLQVWNLIKLLCLNFIIATLDNYGRESNN